MCVHIYTYTPPGHNLYITSDYIYSALEYIEVRKSQLANLFPRTFLLECENKRS